MEKGTCFLSACPHFCWHLSCCCGIPLTISGGKTSLEFQCKLKNSSSPGIFLAQQIGPAETLVSYTEQLPDSWLLHCKMVIVGMHPVKQSHGYPFILYIIYSHYKYIFLLSVLFCCSTRITYYSVLLVNKS